MDSDNVRQRIKEPTVDAAITDVDNSGDNNNKGRSRRRRTAMARRGLRSLAVAVAVPVSLHLAVVTLFHSDHRTKLPSWLPFRTLQAIFVGSPSLMGLCAWLVWAEGGFHRKPTALAFFLGYLALSLAWEPSVFGMGAVRAGMVVSLAMIGALVGCYRSFKDLNPVAGDLVKVPMFWALCVVCLNLKLLML
ncbi:hypothetical protein U1Q18_020074 [Sarracenia purpurea var. burkii]